MRTTISLDEHLLTQLKKRAAESGTSVSRLIEQAIRMLIRTPPSSWPSKMGAGWSPPTVTLRGSPACAGAIRLRRSRRPPLYTAARGPFSPQRPDCVD